MEVDNYPDYLIYPNGKVQNKKTKRFLKESTTTKKYHQVKLYKCGEKKQFQIHRLVGIHYIPNPENKPTIDHINRNRSDNRIENLRWATLKEQCQNQKEKCLSSRNKSGHKGILFHKSNKKWVYTKQGKHTIYKSFKSKMDCLCFKYIYLLKIKSQLV